MSSTPSIVVARHAPVTERWRGVCYGAIDVEVTLSHDESARVVIESLEHEVHRVWSSPLDRCAGPAAAIASRLGAPHRVDASLIELDHGEFEGRAWDEIHATDEAALARWGERWLDEGPPGGESARDVERRVRSWHDGLQRDRTQLLVAHAGVVRALRVVRGVDEWADAIRAPVAHLEPRLL